MVLATPESGALAIGRSSGELSDRSVGELVNRRRPFPEGAEAIALKFTTLVAELASSASDLTSFLNEGVGHFDEMSRVYRELESEKVGLANQLAEAETKAKVAAAKVTKEQAAVEAARAEAASWKAEAEAAKLREAEAVAIHGQLLRSYTERMFRSKKFSELAGQLALVLNTPIAADAIDEVAADFPDLDKSKYRHVVVSDEALNHAYAEVLVEGTRVTPLLESLAASSEVLTIEVVRDWPVDRDADLETIIAGLDRAAELEAEDAGLRREAAEAEVGAEDADESAPVNAEAPLHEEENVGVVS